MKPSGSEQKQENPYYPAFDLLLTEMLAAEQALNVSEPHSDTRPSRSRSDLDGFGPRDVTYVVQ